MKLDRTRHAATLLLSGLLLALPLGPLAQTASAQCADPRGNAYCSNGGLVTTQNPNPPTNVNVQNPSPPTNVNVQNPNAGNSSVVNPNPPSASAQTGQLTVMPAGGAPGDVVGVSGQGFGSNNLMFLNVVDSAGQTLDTDSRAYSCTETDSTLLNLYQDLGWGCSSGAQAGP